MPKTTNIVAMITEIKRIRADVARARDRATQAIAKLDEALGRLGRLK